MAKVTTSELENIIRAKIKEKGLGADITNDKIKEIKTINHQIFQLLLENKLPRKLFIISG